MVRCASIDIGTNTVRLLIAERAGSSVIPLSRECAITRLGKGLDRTGIINREAQVRTMKCLKKFKDIIIKNDVTEINIIGTSALRDAKNGKSFLHRVRQELGFSIKIISGREEGRTAARGVFSGVINSPFKNLIIDIGGGSTEFIFCENKTPLFIRSLKIGSVRFTERWITNNPVRKNEIDFVLADIKNNLKTIRNKFNLYEPKHLIGVAGTVTTLFTIYKKMKTFDPLKVDGRKIPLTALKNIVPSLASMSVRERKSLSGMDPGRADVIVAGGLILLTVMETFGFDEVIVSDRDILFGAILK